LPSTLTPTLWWRPTGSPSASYEGQAVTPDREAVAYCRIGERSSYTWFVLKELLGYDGVKSYDGSWTEYGSLGGGSDRVVGLNTKGAG
jgi:3-mercaptopyruvate sulfurtransferase SseA